MWVGRIALALVLGFAIALVVIAAKGGITISVNGPVQHHGQTLAHPTLWIAGWLFVIFAAVVIVGATLIRLALRLVNGLLRNWRAT